MASGYRNSYRGSFIGTAATLDLTVVGFRPRTVHLFSRAGDVATWQETMPDAAMRKTTAAGVGSYVTTLGVTPLANGFRLGADTDLNVASEVVDFEALD